MAATRLRKVDTVRERATLIDEYMTEGYEVVGAGELSVMLRKRTWGTAGGHLLWGMLTLWWTLGIGNVIYALIAHKGADRVLLRYHEDMPSLD